MTAVFPASLNKTTCIAHSLPQLWSQSICRHTLIVAYRQQCWSMHLCSPVDPTLGVRLPPESIVQPVEPAWFQSTAAMQPVLNHAGLCMAMLRQGSWASGHSLAAGHAEPICLQAAGRPTAAGMASASGRAAPSRGRSRTRTLSLFHFLVFVSLLLFVSKGCGVDTCEQPNSNTLASVGSWLELRQLSRCVCQAGGLDLYPIYLNWGLHLTLGKRLF